jgi:putative membrane protein insertion efficiency factor
MRPVTSLSLPAVLFIGLIRGYQLFVSPALPASCRYLPTCSEYARQAIAEHGVVKGGFLAAKRILRCHPWGGAGLDPVPERRPEAAAKALGARRGKRSHAHG